MRFSDSILYDTRKPNKYAKYDSSPFNSEDTLSGDTSSQEVSLSTHNLSSNPIFHYNVSYEDTSIKSLLKKTPYSQNDKPIYQSPITRQTKSHYNLRHQPRKDYQLFIPQSNIYDS